MDLARAQASLDYEQPGVSHRQAERAVRTAQDFLELLKEVLHGQET